MYAQENDMKKRVAILFVLILLAASGCAKKPPEETLPADTVPETTAPAAEGTVPELMYATAEVNGIPAVLATVSRGDTVEVVESFDEKHYVLKLEAGYGLVEKNLVRMTTEPAFEAWTGYAYHNATIYDNYRLAGEPVQKLSTNTQVEVLDDLGWCYLVSYDNTSGYMTPESLAGKPISNGGKEKSSPNGEEAQPAGGEDGGEIYLRFQGKVTLLSTITPQKGAVSGKAQVLADGTEVVLGYFDRGDRLPLLAQETAAEGYRTVYLDGLTASVSEAYILLEGEQSFSSWEGSSKYNAALYDDFWMLGSPSDRLNSNTKVQVLYELENCYLVEAEGATGYLAKDKVTPAEASDPQETTAPDNSKAQSGNTGTGPAPTQPAPEKDTASGKTPDQGNAQAKPEKESTPTPETNPTESPSGGDGGSTESAPSENPKPEWTPPML